MIDVEAYFAMCNQETDAPYESQTVLPLTLGSLRDALLKSGVPLKTANAFLLYHVEHPDIWEMFERYTLLAAKRRKRLGAKAIMERIRWELEIEGGKDFKISNSWIAYYARAFVTKYPLYRNYFDFKTIKGVRV